MSGLAAKLRDLGVTVKVLNVRDGEVVVLEVRERLTETNARRIRDAWASALPGERALVVEAKVSVRPGEEPAA